jgi:antitoxin MazE
MQRKVFIIGNSKGVSIPSEYLDRLKLAVGSEVDVTLDEDHNRILVEPRRNKRSVKGVNQKFANEVNEFIEKYRPALNELAKK